MDYRRSPGPTQGPIDTDELSRIAERLEALERKLDAIKVGQLDYYLPRWLRWLPDLRIEGEPAAWP